MFNIQPIDFAVLGLCCIQTIGALFLMTVFRHLTINTSLQKQIPFLTASFGLLAVKGGLLLILYALNLAVGNAPANMITAAINFVFDCVAAVVLLGAALLMSGVRLDKNKFFGGVGTVLLLVGAGTLLFDGTRRLFPVIGTGYLAIEFLTVGAVLFGLRHGHNKQPIVLLSGGFIALGMASLWTVLTTGVFFATCLWLTAVGLILYAGLTAGTIQCTAAEQALQSERQKVRLFLDSSPFPILLTRLPDGQALYTNDEAQRLFGIKAVDLKYFHFANYFSNPKDWARLFTELNEKAVVNNFETKIQNPNTGEQFWFSLDARAIEFGGDLALYTTFRDVTSQKDKEYKLLREALTDPLTGMYNRRQFDVLAQKYIEIAKRHQNAFCLMMLDIDYFKAVNDTFGHDAGDMVLIKLAELLKSITRSSDVLARYGGEEFVLFMPNTTQQEAYFAAERLRDAVERMKFDIAGETRHITVSVGLSAETVFDLNKMVKQADAALYLAKESGRNRTAFYEMGSEDI